MNKPGRGDGMILADVFFQVVETWRTVSCVRRGCGIVSVLFSNVSDFLCMCLII